MKKNDLKDIMEIVFKQGKRRIRMIKDVIGKRPEISTVEEF